MIHVKPQQDDATWALVPVKRLSEAKSRLASALSPAERAELQMAMLDDVLTTLRRARYLRGVAVVTRDAEIAKAARAHGCRIVAESAGCRCLNSALEEGLADLRSAGAARVLIVPADVPFIAPADVDLIAVMGRLRKTLVVPDRDRTGTNGLFVHLDDQPRLAFGVDSFRRHVAPANSVAMETSASSFELDIDTPADLKLAEAVVCQRGGGFATRTAGWIRAHLRLHEKSQP